MMRTSTYLRGDKASTVLAFAIILAGASLCEGQIHVGGFFNNVGPDKSYYVTDGMTVPSDIYVWADGLLDISGGNMSHTIQIREQGAQVIVHGRGFSYSGSLVDGVWTPPSTGVTTLTVTYASGTEAQLKFNFVVSTGVTLDDNGGGNGSTNEPPEAVDDDDAETTINTAVTIDVLDNDSDPDGDPLTIVSVTQPASGTAAIDGESIIYTPTANFVGTDEFDYTISDGKDNEASATVTVTVKPGGIEIDIKPGDDTNRVNLGSNGVIPVAIFSTEGFYATELDPGSIFLAGSGVRVRGKGNKYLASQEDINGDGLLDLVVKIETQNLDPDTFQDGGAYLHVHMTSDQNSPVLYEGWDSLTIVPPAN